MAAKWLQRDTAGGHFRARRRGCLTFSAGAALVSHLNSATISNGVYYVLVFGYVISLLYTQYATRKI